LNKLGRKPTACDLVRDYLSTERCNPNGLPNLGIIPNNHKKLLQLE